MSPLYSHKCRNGHTEDVLMSMAQAQAERSGTAGLNRPCKTCGATLRQVIAAASIPPDGRYSFDDKGTA